MKPRIERIIAKVCEWLFSGKLDEFTRMMTEGGE